MGFLDARVQIKLDGWPVLCCANINVFFFKKNKPYTLVVDLINFNKLD